MTQCQLPTIRVVLADAQRMSLDGMATLLRQAPDLEVVGLVDTGLAAVEQIVALQPAVAVLDADLPLLDGVQVSHYVAMRAPATRVVLLLPAASLVLLDAALEARATSIVLRSTSGETLREVIRATARGEGLLPRELAAHRGAWSTVLHGQRSQAAVGEGLTPRECQVLCLLAQHRSNRAIADELDITEDTVKKHLKSIFLKLHVANRREAADYVQARTHR